MNIRLLFTGLVGLIVASSEATAADYDLSRDYSTNSNPAGVWSYGWKSTLNGQFTPHQNSIIQNYGPGTLIHRWLKNFSGGGTVNASLGATHTSDGGQAVYPPGTVWVGAGSEGQPDNYGVVRFTTPAGGAATYRVQVAARSYLDPGPVAGDSEFHVVVNGTEVFGQFLPVFGATGYTNEMLLAAGDTIDFAVGRGQDGREYASALKIKALITPLVVPEPPPTSIVLSGLVEFSTESSGSFDNRTVWNTRGGDTAVNLWVIQGADRNGPFVNGPSDAQAGISVGLHEGENHFVIYGNAGGTFTHYGLNLFFNGANNTPRISVFGPTQTNAEPPFPPFAVNGSPSTLTLAFQPVAGANTLVFEDGDTRVELTDYRLARPGVYNTDRVSQTAVGPDGGADSIGYFTLNVTRRAVYDLEHDYSTNSNPAGVWSYGWKSALNGEFTRHQNSLLQNYGGGQLIHRWLRNFAGGGTVNASVGTATHTSDNGQAVYPPGTVWVGAGSEGQPDNYGVVRFTTPATGAGRYRVQVAARSYLDPGPVAGDSEFHVVVNGTEVFGQFLPAFGATGYTNEVLLAAGDTIDFAVGRGQDGREYASALKIKALITPVEQPEPPLTSTVLSGLVEFSTESSGSFDNRTVWNTRGGDTAVNLWVIQGSDRMGPFVNGPSDAQAGISIGLHEGENHFVIYGSRGGTFNHYGLNLFFNGNNNTPKISVFGPTQTNAEAPPFAANGSPSTLTLAFQPVAGANTLVFEDGDTRVELSEYRLARPEVYNTDRVSQTVVGPDGGADSIGYFTLNVTKITAVPPTIVTEPQSQTVQAGDSVSFSVVAEGTAPLSYQWFHGTTAISNATAATLTLNSVTEADAGEYSVRVSNAAGSVTSASATLTVTPAPPLTAIALSGLVEFSTDASGNFDNRTVWNTRGGDTAVNLWVIRGGDRMGPFVNGPSDAQAGISIPLREGENRFVIYGNRGGTFSHYGLNLFFNGNNNRPRISVFGPTQTNANPPFPPFSANASPYTLTLAFQPVAGANTLVFEDANTRVELTDYRLARPDVYNMDRVNQNVIAPDGGADSIGYFTLNVTKVPPGECVPAGSGLVAWWRGEGNAQDSAGSNHGQLHGGARFAPGKVGQGFRFDGNGFVLIPDSSSLDLVNEITMEMWFNSETWGEGRTWVFMDKRTWSDCNYGANVSEPWGLQLYYNDPNVWGGDHPGNMFEISAYFPLPSLGVFHHFAGTYRQVDASHIELKTYLDGALVRTRVFSGNLANTVNDIPLAIASARGGADGGAFRGVIDEISLYNRVLSAAEIEAIYRAGSAGKCPPSPPPPTTGFDVSRDFSTDANPAGPWSYGYQTTLGGTFSLYTHGQVTDGDNGVTAFIWSKNGWQPGTVTFNPNSETFIDNNGYGVFPPHTVWFYAGPSGAPDNFAVIRLTIPAGAEGRYRLESTVRSHLDGPLSGDADFYILKNGSEIFRYFLPPRSATGYSNEVTVAAGDTIDFAVGRGPDGILEGSGLKINASLTLVGERPPPPPPGENRPPVARIALSPQFTIGGAPHPLVIACDGDSANIVLDGRGSSDPDGDPLSYAWFAGGAPQPFSTESVARTSADLGLHSVTLTVSDGQLSASASLVFEVVTPAEAVAPLSLLLDLANLSRKAKLPLQASLRAAINSLEDRNFKGAINQLEAFDNKVEAQVGATDPDIAARLSAAARAVIEALGNCE
jgi:uncharacterized membrane protein